MVEKGGVYGLLTRLRAQGNLMTRYARKEFVDTIYAETYSEILETLKVRDKISERTPSELREISKKSLNKERIERNRTTDEQNRKAYYY